VSERNDGVARYRLNLEVGEDGSCMAHVAELPGCIAIGGTREEAVERAREAVEGYVDWLRSRGEAVEKGPVEVEVAQEVRVDGRFPGSPGDQVARFESDAGEATAAEVERALRWLGWSRGDLEALFEGVPYEELDWSPPGESWTLRAILTHVASAEAWYLRHLEPEALRQLPSALIATRRWAERRLREMTEEERSALRVHEGEEWTARKVLRRFLEHEREHAGQLRELVAQWRAQGEVEGCKCFPEGHWAEVGGSEYWRVFVTPEQDYLGKVVIALRRHEEDFLRLSQAERDEMWDIARRAREAVGRLFGPDHWNYQVLGNSLRHVHMHLTPRYREAREFESVRIEDGHWGTWPYPSGSERPGEWLKALAEAVRGELNSGAGER